MTRLEVQRLLKKIGLRPQRAAGQNFLIDQSICDEMIETAEVSAADTVLEIGPGLGILTDRLLAAGARVMAVELDQRLADYLRHRFRGQPRLNIVHGDIFRTRLDTELKDRGYKLVANLPYSATSLVFRNFLTLSPRPSALTVMIQKEVAERIVAEPGKMSLLSLSVQYHADPVLVSTVPPTSFWPAPEVTSAILHAALKDPEPPADERTRVFHLARAAFSGKRKTIANSLSALPEFSKADITNILTRVGISPSARPQDFSLEIWRKIGRLAI